MGATMSFAVNMKDYFSTPRMIHHIDKLHAWTHGQYFSPVTVEISPTHRCNQKCIYCYTNDRAQSRDDMKGLVECVESVTDAGVQGIVMQGTGDPLMHRDLPEAIRIAAKKATVKLTTNGVLLMPKIQEKILQHLLCVRFSVLDSDPDRYAFYHGCNKKQWYHLVENIKHAVMLREYSREISLALHGTIYLNRWNFGKAEEIVKFYRDLGLDYVHVMEPTYSAFSPVGQQKFESDYFSDWQIMDMEDKVLELVDDSFMVTVHFPIVPALNMVDGSCWRKDYCQGIKFSSVVSSSGDVHPCYRYWGRKEYSYGNIFEQSFEEIWKSDRRQEIEALTLSTVPVGGECQNCCLCQLNAFLDGVRHTENKWRYFL
jgi:cyclic pyranopterin phosphate synthase